ncbi:hypothetical protein P278_05770 [Zhouia amylolytica AD3]|uniref:Uncharacterized protein n=1 Tax=Zhouia amylolytica AD3 TaxID=1286632 RepID=W2URC7_9FLAO|nr:hypothetical protein P278_05770 [Zhouia amylolytica AD3]
MHFFYQKSNYSKEYHLIRKEKDIFHITNQSIKIQIHII